MKKNGRKTKKWRGNVTVVILWRYDSLFERCCRRTHRTGGWPPGGRRGRTCFLINWPRPQTQKALNAHRQPFRLFRPLLTRTRSYSFSPLPGAHSRHSCMYTYATHTHVVYIFFISQIWISNFSLFRPLVVVVPSRHPHTNHIIAVFLCQIFLFSKPLRLCRSGNSLSYFSYCRERIWNNNSIMCTKDCFDDDKRHTLLLQFSIQIIKYNCTKVHDSMRANRTLCQRNVRAT